MNPFTRNLDQALRPLTLVGAALALLLPTSCSNLKLPSPQINTGSSRPNLSHLPDIAENLATPLPNSKISSRSTTTHTEAANAAHNGTELAMMGSIYKWDPSSNSNSGGNHSGVLCQTSSRILRDLKAAAYLDYEACNLKNWQKYGMLPNTITGELYFAYLPLARSVNEATTYKLKVTLTDDQASIKELRLWNCSGGSQKGFLSKRINYSGTAPTDALVRGVVRQNLQDPSSHQATSNFYRSAIETQGSLNGSGNWTGQKTIISQFEQGSTLNEVDTISYWQVDQLQFTPGEVKFISATATEKNAALFQALPSSGKSHLFSIGSGCAYESTPSDATFFNCWNGETLNTFTPEPNTGFADYLQQANQTVSAMPPTSPPNVVFSTADDSAWDCKLPSGRTEFTPLPSPQATINTDPAKDFADCQEDAGLLAEAPLPDCNGTTF